MGIRRYVSCNPVALRTLAAKVVLIVVVMTGTVTGLNLSRVLADTGNAAPGSSSPEGAHVATVNDPTARCSESDSTCRAKYQVALDRFKAGQMKEAEDAFRALAGGENGSLMVRACSLNMVGQIALLSGEKRKACEAFEHLTALLEPVLVNESRSADPLLVRLFGTACIGTAEISEQTGDPKAAIAEYERVLRACSALADDPWLKAQRPRILDELAQRKLSLRDVDGYLQCVDRLRQEHPAYERAVLAGLEVECVRLLQQSGGPALVPQNSYEAPTWAIAYARSRGDPAVRQRLLDIATSVCQTPRTYAELVACYQAAWVFDALGGDEEATRRFSQVASADLKTPKADFIAGRTIETIRGYARVQYAILLAEAGRCDEALRSLAAAPTPRSETHLATLTEAARKNIDTLKREVFSNGK